jgi:nucleoside-diphosphate-sugar epimerase
MPNSPLPFGNGNGFASVETPDSARILVLGASGFLGRYVSQRLAGLGIEHLRVGRHKRPELDAAVDLVEAPQHEVDQLVESYAPTAVVNCSGAVRGNTDELTRGNVVSVHALLNALLWSAPQARLIQLGTSAEYGAVEGTPPMDEATPTHPTSPYGFTKLAASALVLRARTQFADATVLRIFNVSGPQSPTSTMLGRLVEQLSTAGPVPTLTLDSVDGWRDYIDVRDAAQAACAAALSDSPLPAVLNIGSGTAVQTREWVEQLIAISQTNARVILSRDSHGSHKSSVGAVAWQCADIAAAKAALGWSPTIELATSIADTWTARQAANQAV